MDELTGKQRRYLRGMGNRLQATVYVGREGIGEGLIQAIEDGYNTAELLKIRIERGCPMPREEAAEELADRTGSHLVQVLGQTVLLFRAAPDEDDRPGRIRLPD